jgi:hypothetical protein
VFSTATVREVKVVNVVVYLANAPEGETVSFDVPPRLHERLDWLDPETKATGVDRVVHVRHERVRSGFTYGVGIERER